MNAEERIRALVAWARDNGAAVHPKLDLAATVPNKGLGAVATAAISEGELLLSVPLRLAIGPAATAGDWAAGLRAAYSRCKHPPSPFIQTCLSLLHLQSRVKANASDGAVQDAQQRTGPAQGQAGAPHYSDYVRMLDHVQDPDTPSTWSAEELDAA